MMVMYYGFNEKIGNVSYYDSTGQRDMGIQKPYSEETAKLIDEEVRRLVNDAYRQTKELLQKNKESLKKVADLLLKKEVIFREDIESILGARAGSKSAPEENMETKSPAVVG